MGSGAASGTLGSGGQGAGWTSTVLLASLLGEAWTFSISALPKPDVPKASADTQIS